MLNSPRKRSRPAASSRSSELASSYALGAIAIGIVLTSGAEVSAAEQDVAQRAAQRALEVNRRLRGSWAQDRVHAARLSPKEAERLTRQADAILRRVTERSGPGDLSLDHARQQLLLEATLTTLRRDLAAGVLSVPKPGQVGERGKAKLDRVLRLGAHLLSQRGIEGSDKRSLDLTEAFTEELQDQALLYVGAAFDALLSAGRKHTQSRNPPNDRARGFESQLLSFEWATRAKTALEQWDAQHAGAARPAAANTEPESKLALLHLLDSRFADAKADVAANLRNLYRRGLERAPRDLELARGMLDDLMQAARGVGFAHALPFDSQIWPDLAVAGLARAWSRLLNETTGQFLRQLETQLLEAGRDEGSVLLVTHAQDAYLSMLENVNRHAYSTWIDHELATELRRAAVTR